MFNPFLEEQANDRLRNLHEEAERQRLAKQPWRHVAAARLRSLAGWLEAPAPIGRSRRPRAAG